MPTFNAFDYFDSDIDIEVEEFVDCCSSEEKRELIKLLNEEGYTYNPTGDFEIRGVAEQHYEDALVRLSGKWNRLSKEQEEYILAIANTL